MIWRLVDIEAEQNAPTHMHMHVRCADTPINVKVSKAKTYIIEEYQFCNRF